LVPAFDSRDDLVWVFSPNEGARFGVGVGDEGMDRVFEVLHGAKDAALEAALGEGCKQTFDGIEPGRRGRSEVEDEAGMTREPLQNLGMFVRGVVVDDDMDGLLGVVPVL